MKKLHLTNLTFLVFVLGLVCCTNQPESNESPIKIGLGNKSYGGTLYLVENDIPPTLFPLKIADAVSASVSSQIYEGLFKLNPKTLEVENCLIDTFFTDSTHTLYTFRLKDSVFFHKHSCFKHDKDRQLDANDVAMCFTNLCRYSESNHAFSVFHNLVSGADSFYHNSKNNLDNSEIVSGINVKDRLTFTIKLNHPSKIFPQILSEHQTFIYPNEYFLFRLNEKNTQIGTGPFCLMTNSTNNIVLAKNEDYHMEDELGNQLPFLDSLVYTFIEDKHDELSHFLDHKSDIIFKLPSDLIFDLAMHSDSSNFDYPVAEFPEMSLDFIGFNHQSELFSNIYLRKAIAMALNKKKILERGLDGAATEPGYHGVTPPVFSQMGYDVDSIDSHAFNADSAKTFLELSGIFSGASSKNLTLYYNVEGHRYDRVVNTISQELKKHLGIDLLLKPLSLKEFDDAVLAGVAEFFLTSWIYEYPHPQHHLAGFYTGEKDFLKNISLYPNIFRYKNKAFDELYDRAFESEDNQKANQLFLEAEKLAIDDVVIIPLWYDEGYVSQQDYVKGFYTNALEYKDFRYVFLEKVERILPE